jgi:hypothetical protein
MGTYTNFLYVNENFILEHSYCIVNWKSWMHRVTNFLKVISQHTLENSDFYPRLEQILSIIIGIKSKCLILE